MLLSYAGIIDGGQCVIARVYNSYYQPLVIENMFY